MKNEKYKSLINNGLDFSFFIFHFSFFIFHFSFFIFHFSFFIKYKLPSSPSNPIIFPQIILVFHLFFTFAANHKVFDTIRLHMNHKLDTLFDQNYSFKGIFSHSFKTVLDSPLMPFVRNI